MKDIEWVLWHAEEALVTLIRLEQENDVLRDSLRDTRVANNVLGAALKRAERPLWRKLLRLD